MKLISASHIIRSRDGSEAFLEGKKQTKRNLSKSFCRSRLRPRVIVTLLIIFAHLFVPLFFLSFLFVLSHLWTELHFRAWPSTSWVIALSCWGPEVEIQFLGKEINAKMAGVVQGLYGKPCLYSVSGRWGLRLVLAALRSGFCADRDREDNGLTGRLRSRVVRNLQSIA